MRVDVSASLEGHTGTALSLTEAHARVLSLAGTDPPHSYRLRTPLQGGETDMLSKESGDKHHITVGDLCRALDEGRIPARVRDGAYEVRWADIRRLGEQAAPRRIGRQLRPQPARRRPAS